MSTEALDLTEPELVSEDLLVLDDPQFVPETVVVVTGAASGIGQATAIALAANSLTVIGADIDEDGIQETIDIAEDLGTPGEVRVVPTDLTNDTDVETMIEVAAEQGELRYLANIAGLQHIASIPDFPVEKYDLLLDIMLRVPFLTTKAAMPHIHATDDGVGAIGNMSSVHGHFATQDKPAYIIAKHTSAG
nr:SDR family NAD(P)-dependent oxidoreductase [Saliphagus infecundisoli]